MNSKVLTLLFAVVLVLGGGYILFNNKDLASKPDQIKNSSQALLREGSSSEKKQNVIRAIATNSSLSQKDARQVSEHLKKVFGQGLSLQFSADGGFESATGNLAQGLASSKDFNSKDEASVRLRAKEVLKEVLSESGSSDSISINEGVVTTGEHSAQVFFQQNHDGVSFEPSGRFTVDLGPQGELLGAHSDLVNGYEVIGEFVKAPPSQNSLKIFWIDTSTTPPKARASYQTYEKGRQIVTDATTGQVIFQRDRRNF